FVTPERERSWLETVPEGRHRFVVDSDFMAEVSRFSDAAPEYRSVPQTGPATPDGTSYAEWAKVANALAGKLDLRSGDRVLVDPGKHGEPVMWLLAPLSAGASIVMWANADPGTLDERIAAEGITRVL
ncbi:MAG TPA: hypothetical protein VF062_27105, partial [Candidatus Limnocylindrales bacterium]